MLFKIALFVSKRLPKPATTMLCIMLMQLAGILSSCQPEPSAMAARLIGLP
jgi:hypothetical protein